MAVVDHLAVTVDDIDRAVAQLHPVMQALGYTRHHSGQESWWRGEGLVEILLYPAREAGTGPHAHGRVGWQHLAYGVATRSEVDELHAIAVANGFTVVGAPKVYPRFSPRYYAAFVETVDGIRLEFVFNPPPDAAPPTPEEHP